MYDVVLDSIFDSIKVFIAALILNVILSFFETKLTHLLANKNKKTPLIGAGFGLIPQCGISVFAADLYQKKHITIGTILAVFYACSDEALPILLTDKEKAITIIPIVLIKFIFGFVLGYLVDIFITKQDINKDGLETLHIGCCGHEIDCHEDSKIKKHIVHPLKHSFKILLYVLLVNIVFGVIIYLVTEERIISFLANKQALTPLFSCIVGMIPNCASSVLITELYIHNNIGFSALLGGLCTNAGLGILYLLKFKEKRLDTIKIICILFIYSLLVSYIMYFILLLLK